jgi:hypothetical protein
MLIGEVVSSKTGDVEQHASVSVKPSVNFSKVHEVFILTKPGIYEIWKDDGGKFQRPSIQ